MSLIEGIGDEVLQFFGFVFVSLIGVIAWWSTGIRERPQIRTVLILEHRSPNNLGNSHSPPRDNVSSSTVDTEATEASTENTEDTPNDEVQTNSETVNVTSSEGVPNRDLIKERRLAYFQPQETPTKASSSDNISTEPVSQEENDVTATDNIRIRLKYLNDDQKLVEGRLQELLGDFKRRHFSDELSADKLVRLIFNGQVLQCDDQTLQGYGLYDNCVVHCLVHAQRTNINRTSSQPQGNAAPQECNLGLLLYASISVILGLAWFFRYHYSQFFTITATAGLLALTALFASLVIGLHMQDQETVPTQ